VMTLSPTPPGARVAPQNTPSRPNYEDKTAGLNHPRMSHLKLASSPSRTDRSIFGFRPGIALRTKWTDFSGSLRDSARNLTLDFGRRLRQCRFEAGRLSVPEHSDVNADDAG
jgi:hypothetical protein